MTQADGWFEKINDIENALVDLEDEIAFGEKRGDFKTPDYWRLNFKEAYNALSNINGLIWELHERK